jgi:hypothetical protein
LPKKCFFGKGMSPKRTAAAIARARPRPAPPARVDRRATVYLPWFRSLARSLARPPARSPARSLAPSGAPCPALPVYLLVDRCASRQRFIGGPLVPIQRGCANGQVAWRADCCPLPSL